MKKNRTFIIFAILFSIILLLAGCVQQETKKEEKINESKVEEKKENKTTEVKEEKNQTEKTGKSEVVSEEELNDLFTNDLDKAIEEINLTG
jgi:predicted membrane protein